MNQRPKANVAARPGSASGRGVAVAIAAGVLVVVAVVIFVLVGTGGKGSKRATPAPADVVHAATSVPQATLDAVAAGKTSLASPPEKTSTTQTLTQGGKPLVVYEGAEFCPYCAAERWAMVVALSKFGTFHNLGQTTSSSTDVYPNTPTFSFYGASYTSPYLDFQAVEEATRTGATLQKPTALQTKLYNTYEKPPYVRSTASAGIPFVDFANRYVIVGATYPPTLLRDSSNQPLPMGTIAGILADPSAPTARGVDGAANYMIGALCTLTGNKPAATCSSSAAIAAKKVLASAPVGMPNTTGGPTSSAG